MDFKVGSLFNVNRALSDPLPAGVEPINNNLRGNRSLAPGKDIDGDDSDTSGSRITKAQAEERDWFACTFEHENLRDNQAEAFLSLLEPGKYKHTYVVRATTKGTFTAAPSKIEEMYSRETFGRAQSDTVIVE